MLSKQERQAEFQELLDHIGPGIRLHVDDFVLKAIFGSVPGESLDSVIERAREFAERNHCGCIYRSGDTAVFVRAYSKNS